MLKVEVNELIDYIQRVDYNSMLSVVKLCLHRRRSVHATQQHCDMNTVTNTVTICSDKLVSWRGRVFLPTAAELHTISGYNISLTTVVWLKKKSSFLSYFCNLCKIYAYTKYFTIPAYIFKFVSNFTIIIESDNNADQIIRSFIYNIFIKVFYKFSNIFSNQRIWLMAVPHE